ncbi:hypothetical protein [Flaviflagellibacter deserti]|uniref:DUF4166 domain-containing protein n=1 Tax=Flaviflagellibacter deserti TaxID=2267266 RepID=A0ABV9Z5Q3_9HYPH
MAERKQPSRRRCSTAFLNDMLAIHAADRPNFFLRKYLGSMLVMDFGDQIPIRTFRGDDIEVGEFNIGVRNCYWELFDRSERILTSETIEDDRIIEKAIFKHSVSALNLFQRKGFADLEFTEPGLMMRFDITGKWEDRPGRCIVKFDFLKKCSIQLTTFGHLMYQEWDTSW